jgi:hypothetical protein
MDTESQLLDETWTLLAKRPADVTFERIARESGLSIHWLHKMSRRAIPDPGVVRVERLHRYLRSVCLSDAA